MKDTEKRKHLALELVYSINPEAPLLYTKNRNGQALCNGLTVEDCSNLCAAVDEAFTQKNNKEAAKVAHTVPLFAFAMLSQEEVEKFVLAWMDMENKSCV